MTRFRASKSSPVRTLTRHYCGALCASALIWVIATSDASSQSGDVTGPPTGITPPSSEPLEGDDSPLRSITERPGLNDGGIQVGNLSGIDTSGVGLLGPNSGGFSSDLWEGSERLVIETLLPKLPVATPSATMNRLARRLLLTTGPLPDGVTRGNSFLALRLERLLSAGFVDDLSKLAAVGASAPAQPNVLGYQAQAGLLKKEYGDSCSIASRTSDSGSDPFWLKLRAFCFAVSGEDAAADLTADLLREQGVDSPSFFALITRMTTGADIEIPEQEEVDSLLLALYGQLGVSPTADALSSSSPAVLAALAVDDRFGLDARLVSAQSAVNFGALPADRLGEIYDQFEFSAEELSNALTLIEDMPPERGQALIYRMLKTLTVPSALAEALRAATILAKENGSYLATAQLYWPILRGLTPSEPYAEVAADIGTMALVNGDAGSAYEWYAISKNNPRSANADTRDLRILLAVGAPSAQLPWQSSDPLQWLNASLSGSPEYYRLTQNIQLLEGLGYPVSRDTQLKMLEAPLQRVSAQTSTVVLSKLKGATISERLGEVVLLSLITIGEGGPAAASLSDLLEAYGSLSAVGLGNEARQIALEAVIGSKDSVPEAQSQ